MSHQAQQAREAFGARLRDLRKDAGLTGRALADLTGWQLSKISKIEHGKQNASENDIREWCRHSNAFALLHRSAVYGSPARALITKAIADLG